MTRMTRKKKLCGSSSELGLRRLPLIKTPVKVVLSPSSPNHKGTPCVHAACINFDPSKCIGDNPQANDRFKALAATYWLTWDRSHLGPATPRPTPTFTATAPPSITTVPRRRPSQHMSRATKAPVESPGDETSSAHTEGMTRERRGGRERGRGCHIYGWTFESKVEGLSFTVHPSYSSIIQIHPEQLVKLFRTRQIGRTC